MNTVTIFYTLIVILSWGVVGYFQKLTTRFLSTNASLIWQTAGFILMIPVFLPNFIFPVSYSLLKYSNIAIILGLLVGFINNLGALFLFASLKNNGKASVVCPVVAMAPPMGMIILAPFFERVPDFTARGWRGVRTRFNLPAFQINDNQFNNNL